MIPKVIDEFKLSMKVAGAFHYVPMAAIATGAILLGFLADSLGRFDRSVIDGTVNTVGEAGRAIALDLRDYFDTLIIEGLVNGAGGKP